MQTFVEIIDAFPGQSETQPDGALAARLEVSRGLIAVWKHRDKIPSRYWSALIAAAKTEKVGGVTYELLARIEAQKPRKRA